MAKSLAQFFTFFLAIALTLTALTIHLTMADGGDCSNDIADLSKNCMEFIKFPSNPKMAPSKGCCGAVKKCDMKCVCDHVTKEIEKAICMEKVVYVADQCGRPLAKGTKCGSYEVPPGQKLR